MNQILAAADASAPPTVAVPIMALAFAGIAVLVILGLLVVYYLDCQTLTKRCNEQVDVIETARVELAERAESIALDRDQISRIRQSRSLDTQQFEKDLDELKETLRQRDGKIRFLLRSRNEDRQTYFHEREQSNHELIRVQQAFRSLYAGIVVSSVKALEDQPVLTHEAHGLLAEFGVNVRVEVVDTEEVVADEVTETNETASV